MMKITSSPPPAKKSLSFKKTAKGKASSQRFKLRKQQQQAHQPVELQTPPPPFSKFLTSPISMKTS